MTWGLYTRLPQRRRDVCKQLDHSPERCSRYGVKGEGTAETGKMSQLGPRGPGRSRVCPRGQRGARPGPHGLLRQRSAACRLQRRTVLSLSPGGREVHDEQTPFLGRARSPARGQPRPHGRDRGGQSQLSSVPSFRSPNPPGEPHPADPI